MAEFIAKARKARKTLGGGMRQAGVIAAAGVVALETMVERLAEDHEHARILATGLAKVPGVRIDPDAVQTNIVIFEIAGDHLTFQRRLRDAGLLTTPIGGGRVRMVTHYGIARADIDEALDRVRRVEEAAA
jgi:threonine aldolase